MAYDMISTGDMHRYALIAQGSVEGGKAADP